MPRYVLFLLLILISTETYGNGFIGGIPMFVDLSYARLPGGNNQLELETGLAGLKGMSVHIDYITYNIVRHKLFSLGAGIYILPQESIAYYKFKLFEIWYNEDHLIDSDDIFGVPLNSSRVSMTFAGKILNMDKLNKDVSDIKWIEISQGIGYRFIDEFTSTLMSEVLLHFGFDSYKADRMIYHDIYNAIPRAINVFTTAAAFHAFVINEEIMTDLNISYKGFFSSPKLTILSARLRNDFLIIHNSIKPHGNMNSPYFGINVFITAGYEVLKARDQVCSAFNLGVGIAFQ